MQQYANLPQLEGVVPQLIYNEQQGHYLLLAVGWHGKQYWHHVILHLELRDDKIWIHYDYTERGIAEELVAAGIPQKTIVLGFRPPKVRPYTGFAEG